MKSKYILMIVGFVLLLSSCYEQQTWVDKNVKEGGNYYPYIQLVDVSNLPESGLFTEGDAVDVRVQYWSVDPVSSLDLYATVNGTEGLVSSTPYTYSFDAESNAEVTTLAYTVPTGSSGTNIDLRVVVVNENELTREKTTSISVE